MPARLRICLAALAGAGLFAAGQAASQETGAPTVAMAQGSLEGIRQGAVDAFLGVPFAAPPIGQNRWRAPQPAAAWSGLRKATRYGANCIQARDQGNFGPWTHEYVVTDNFSEDCLYLNVWRPTSAAAGARLPVFVWIHGGGFNAGSGAVPIYDGRNLASRDMVVVTTNYRLGPLGFLALPELTREAGAGPVSNFGIQDQIAALRWVRDNISAFGGDPRQVTIGGQSAGSMAVHTLVSSPLAKGLFVRAIAQAGLPVGRMTPDLAGAEKAGSEYMARLGAADLAALRQLPPERFLPEPGAPPLRFGVITEGRLLPAPPAEMVISGRANDVPMMVGQNGDENVGALPVGAGVTEQAWRSALETSFKDHAAAIGALYPAATDAERATALRTMRLDRGLAGLWLWGEARGKTNRSPLYVYNFRHVEPGPEAAKWGSFHSSEIPYVFGTLDKSPDRPFTFADWRVSLAMSELWSNFIKTGSPGAAAPRFRADDPQMVRIDEIAGAAPIVAPDKRKAYRDFVAAGGSLSAF